jgi:AmmeMemoRadiSam system protein A
VIRIGLLVLLVTSQPGCVRKAKPDLDAPAVSSSTSAHTLVQTGYPQPDRAKLLGLARESLRRAALGEQQLTVPAGLHSRLLARRGCFVTLTIKGELRGCVGNLLPEQPLAEAVISSARLAALHDSRFTPVTPDEVPRIDIEVSVLTVPEPLHFDSPEGLLAKLRPGEDGVVLKIGTKISTFLPQVWQQLPDPSEFMSRLSEKAGVPPQAWRDPGAEILLYRVEAFKESEVHRD